VSTDAGWGDYLATSTPVGDAGGADADAGAAAEPAAADPAGLPDPAATVGENEVAAAAADQGWADWHAATGNDWQDSANDYLAYAQQNAEAGYTDIAASALDTAAAHSEIADDHYETATDYDALIADRVETAAADGVVYE
jgi:hypothetical protein